MPDENWENENTRDGKGGKETPPVEEASLNSKLSEYENDLKRLQAEFENYRKRVEKERKDWFENGKAHAMKGFLVLADEFEAAKQHSANADAKSLAKGIELLDAKLHGAFKSFKIEEIKCEGHVDASLHDVLMQAEGGKEGEIAQVIRKGYRMGEAVLRHAQVSVYSGAKKEEEKKQEADKPPEKEEENAGIGEKGEENAGIGKKAEAEKTGSKPEEKKIVDENKQ